MKELTLENITNEDIVEMAKYILQLEQITKDQKGYIIQLETMIQQRNSQLKKANEQIWGVPTTPFIEVEGKLEL
jgi:hypothetical protein